MCPKTVLLVAALWLATINDTQDLSVLLTLPLPKSDWLSGYPLPRKRGEESVSSQKRRVFMQMNSGKQTSRIGNPISPGSICFHILQGKWGIPQMWGTQDYWPLSSGRWGRIQKDLCLSVWLHPHAQQLESIVLCTTFSHLPDIVSKSD